MKTAETAFGSDAEAVLEGYRTWGGDVASRLEGVFAFAVWDQRTETLLCARDPMGRHPFFYAQPGDDLVFSWDLETVRRHPRVPRGLNRVLLAARLMHFWIGPDESYLEGIHRLPAAHVLRFQRGRLETFCYWDPAPPGRPIPWVTSEELTAFPALLEEATARTMQFGPTGILLSGGLDSVSVAAWASGVAARRQWPTPRAFSLAFPEEYSEEQVQRSVAAKLGLPQTFRRLTDYAGGRGLLGRLIDQTARFPGPPINPFGAPFSDLLEVARSQGCEAVLTGEGGDEWLTVTPQYAADLMRSGDWKGVGRLLQTVLSYWRLPRVPAIRNVLWTCGLRAVARNWVWQRAPGLARRRRRRLISRALPHWLAPDPALRRELRSRYDQTDAGIHAESFYLQAIRTGLQHALVGLAADEMFYRDVLAGVPSFHPYLDRRLVEFLLRTPPEVLNQGGRSKALVRQALAERFPQLGFDRQKKVTGPADWQTETYRREGPRLWEGLGKARLLAGLGVVEIDGYHEMLRSAQRSADHRAVQQIWRGANVEAWARAHV